MTRATQIVGMVCVAIVAGAAGVAVRGQAREVEPPKVTVANKISEPVPVAAAITRVADGVRFELTPQTIADLKDQLVVRIAPVEWEYRELKVATSPGNYRSVMTQLAAAGAEGWETTGVTFSDAGSTVMILKRSRMASR